MEKYFVIKPDSALYSDYFNYLDDVKNNSALFDAFAKKHKIEASSFIPSKKYLCIIPTEKDKDKFRNDFTQSYLDGGARQFKIRSNIGKDWINVMSDIRPARKPNYFGLINVYGRFYERLFHIGTDLYGSLSADCDFDLHKCMTEIKASEFYKIIETHADGDSIILKPVKDKCVICGCTEDLIKADGITICRTHAEKLLSHLS